jgi:hypothetical protein
MKSYAQDWLLIIGKLDIHGYIIKGLLFELWRDQRSKGSVTRWMTDRTDLSLLKLAGETL